MVAVNLQADRGSKDWRVAFGKQAQAHLQLSERELYYYLLNIDEFPALAPKAQQVVTDALTQAQTRFAEAEATPRQPPLFGHAPATWVEQLQAWYRQHRAVPPASPLSADRLDDVLKQYAPHALLDGCWLQNISLAATNHTEITARLFRLYASTIGDGDTSKHYGNLYRDLLHSARIYMPEVSSRLFSRRSDINDKAFTGPVFQLALSLFPRVYLPELIGFTLGHVFARQDCPLVALADEIKRHGLDDRYCRRDADTNRTKPETPLLLELPALYLDGFDDDAERQQQAQRIWNGVAAHLTINEAWQQDLRETLDRSGTLTPHHKMLAMVREKARYARHMHRNRKLGGHPLNDWFAQEPFDAEGFLKALAASPYINLEAPLESPLLTRAIAFGGPMFRIFTEAEQAIMADWVQSLTTESLPLEPPPRPLAEPSASGPPITPLRPDESADLASYAKCNKRELYYYFVNADLYPDVLPTARQVALRYFKRAKADMAKRRLPEPLRLFPYSHDAFQARIQQIYASETSAYEAFVPPSTVPREIMVWFIQQYAPFPMVDGSWVQHIAKAGASQTEISARLFRIYSDEVGNADTRMNHPNVYRRLLEKEGIHMPPTDTLEFALQPALRDFAFDLPLLTLSVSLFPKAFLPEIIGVNLAIELSGLGKGYMQIIDELRYWQMDPYFFTLHLTIDNMASGHTAVAMETVQLYLDQILAAQGHHAMQCEWERIWTGYLAFKQNMTRFDATLEREASLRFLLPLLRQSRFRKQQLKSAQPPASQG